MSDRGDRIRPAAREDLPAILRHRRRTFELLGLGRDAGRRTRPAREARPILRGAGLHKAAAIV